MERKMAQRVARRVGLRPRAALAVLLVVILCGLCVVLQRYWSLRITVSTPVPVAEAALKRPSHLLRSGLQSLKDLVKNAGVTPAAKSEVKKMQSTPDAVQAWRARLHARLDALIPLYEKLSLITSLQQTCKSLIVDLPSLQMWMHQTAEVVEPVALESGEASPETPHHESTGLKIEVLLWRPVHPGAATEHMEAGNLSPPYQKLSQQQRVRVPVQSPLITAIIQRESNSEFFPDELMGEPGLWAGRTTEHFNTTIRELLRSAAVAAVVTATRSRFSFASSYQTPEPRASVHKAAPFVADGGKGEREQSYVRDLNHVFHSQFSGEHEHERDSTARAEVDEVNLQCYQSGDLRSWRIMLREERRVNVEWQFVDRLESAELREQMPRVEAPTTAAGSSGAATSDDVENGRKGMEKALQLIEREEEDDASSEILSNGHPTWIWISNYFMFFFSITRAPRHALSESEHGGHFTFEFPEYLRVTLLGLPGREGARDGEAGSAGDDMSESSKAHQLGYSPLVYASGRHKTSRGTIRRTIGILLLNSSPQRVHVRRQRSGRVVLTMESSTGATRLFILPGPTPSDVLQQYYLLTGFPSLPPKYALGYIHGESSPAPRSGELLYCEGFPRSLMPPNAPFSGTATLASSPVIPTWVVRSPRSSEPPVCNNSSEVERKSGCVEKMSYQNVWLDPSCPIVEQSLHRKLLLLGVAALPARADPSFSPRQLPSVVILDVTNPEARALLPSLLGCMSCLNRTEEAEARDRGEKRRLLLCQSPVTLEDLRNLERLPPRGTQGDASPTYQCAVHPSETFFRTISQEALRHVYTFLFSMSQISAVLRVSNFSKRPFIMSPRFLPGSQRHGAVGTGAEKWFPTPRTCSRARGWHLLQRRVGRLVQLSMSGIPFNGENTLWELDCEKIGGRDAAQNTSVKPSAVPSWGNSQTDLGDEELLVRSYQLSSFSPLFFANSQSGMSSISTKAKQLVANTVAMRYHLLPYLYTCFWLSHAQGELIVKPMFYMHPGVDNYFRPPQCGAEDERELGGEECFLQSNEQQSNSLYYFGDALLVAPITHPARGVDGEDGVHRVNLPLAHFFDFWTGRFHAPNTTVDFPGDYALRGVGVSGRSTAHGVGTLPRMLATPTMPLFIRSGSIMPLNSVVRSSAHGTEDGTGSADHSGPQTGRYTLAIAATATTFEPPGSDHVRKDRLERVDSQQQLHPLNLHRAQLLASGLLYIDDGHTFAFATDAVYCQVIIESHISQSSVSVSGRLFTACPFQETYSRRAGSTDSTRRETMREARGADAESNVPLIDTLRFYFPTNTMARFIASAYSEAVVRVWDGTSYLEMSRVRLRTPNSDGASHPVLSAEVPLGSSDADEPTIRITPEEGKERLESGGVVEVSGLRIPLWGHVASGNEDWDEYMWSVTVQKPTG